MTDKGSSAANIYELPLPSGESAVVKSTEREGRNSLPETILLRNVLWFCRLRWVIAVLFACFGSLRFFPEILQYLGLKMETSWPFVTAAGVGLANIGFLIHSRILAGSLTSARAKMNLWVQIFFDLFIITMVVHHIGSIETYAPFAYLFHVVLACIFFSRVESFVVTAASSALYVILIVLEESHLINAAGIYADPVLRGHIEGTPLSFLIVISAIVIWFVVWHLASYLSAMVRERDHELVEANRRLVEAQKTKNMHMLRTAHELKAPFSAIHANAQLLSKGYCGHLTDEALDVVRRISARCSRLAAEIQEMLQLANLNDRRERLCWDELDLAEILDWTVHQVQQVAEEHEVKIESSVQPVKVVGVRDHLKMFFENILFNAILYSHKGGQVKVYCGPRNGDNAVVTVEDHGIGIAGDKLPHIFDEYYRTDEAAKHNRGSTGLGLSIVEHISRTHGIRVLVESEPGKGTKFTMNFGRTETGSKSTAERGVNNGVFADN